MPPKYTKWLGYPHPRKKGWFGIADKKSKLVFQNLEHDPIIWKPPEIMLIFIKWCGIVMIATLWGKIPHWLSGKLQDYEFSTLV